MLKLQEVRSFAPIVNQVVGDLLKRVELLRSRSQDQATVTDMAAELYKFGFEGARCSSKAGFGGVKGRLLIPLSLFPLAAISRILFETRLGCLQEEIPADIQRFISAVSDMLTLSETVVLLPRWSRGVLPFWKRFIQAWDDLFDTGTQQMERRKETVQSSIQQTVNFLLFSSDPHRQENR